MKELLLQYAQYNLWANKRIIDVLLKLDDARVDLDLGSSFPTIRKTVHHVWGAEDIWMQRLELREQPVSVLESFTGNLAEACQNWEATSGRLIEFTGRQFDDRSFDHEVQYHTLKKERFKNTMRDILMHVFNHSTFHRGQLVTMLRQAGVTTIPPTDLIFRLRK